MKFLIPTPKDAFRLVNDLTLATPGVHVGDREWLTTLPAGTVVSIESMRWNKLFKMDSMVRIRILVSPDARISLKKHGGTAGWGKGFSLPVAQLRELDVEIVENFR